MQVRKVKFYSRKMDIIKISQEYEEMQIVTNRTFHVNSHSNKVTMTTFELALLVTAASTVNML